jgi:hypothetical protein
MTTDLGWGLAVMRLSDAFERLTIRVTCACGLASRASGFWLLASGFRREISIAGLTLGVWSL